MDKQLELKDYLAIARRRKWYLIVPPIVFLLVAVAWSFSLRPRYTSQTLVLVQAQKVADSLVKPAVTEDLNQRLSTMKEQILSRSRLEPIMRKFGLYKEQANKQPLEDLIDEMRRQIAVSPIHGGDGSTPGFFISFTADNPKIAQDVCSEITSLFMEENLKLREERAVGTTDFLASQLQQSKRNLDAQDEKLAAFQRKYMGKLPADASVNINMLASLKSQLDAVTQSLDRAQQDKLYTESLLAQENARLQSIHGSAGSVPPPQIDAQLQRLEEQLVGLEARYTPEHPDVIKTRQMIAQLEQSLEKNKKEQPKTAADAQPSTVAPKDSPTLQGLRDSAHALSATIKGKSAEQAKLQQQITQYEDRIQLSPTVEEEYKKLTRDYQTAQAFYDDLLARKSQSEMATDLERRQQGEQFRIVDPANLPQVPSYPKRPLLAAEGFVFGLGFGVSIVFLLEILTKAIRSESDVEFYLKVPLLTSIPDLKQCGKYRSASKTFWRRHDKLQRLAKASFVGGR